jgi:tetratricopeptide (TPR) repeat protein
VVLRRRHADLGWALIMQADPRSERVLEEALEIIERTGYAEFAAWHWLAVGGARHSIQGRDEEALALYERAIAVADAVGEPVTAGFAHAYRGILRAERGDGEAALDDLGPAMERSVASGAGLAITPLQVAISYAQASAGLLEQARASLEECLNLGAAGGLFDMGAGPLE